MCGVWFGAHLGGPKDDFMLEIYFWKLCVTLDLTLPRYRTFLDLSDEYLVKEFINETKVSDQNADKV